jgi:hypothetical protein
VLDKPLSLQNASGNLLDIHRDIAVFPAFALLNPDDHALAVDRGGRKADGFGNSQTGRVTDGQHHPVLQVIHGTRETRHFFLAQNDGQILGLMAGGDIVLDDPGSLEGEGAEEPERGHRDQPDAADFAHRRVLADARVA